MHGGLLRPCTVLGLINLRWNALFKLLTSSPSSSIEPSCASASLSGSEGISWDGIRLQMLTRYSVPVFVERMSRTNDLAARRNKSCKARNYRRASHAYATSTSGHCLRLMPSISTSWLRLTRERHAPTKSSSEMKARSSAFIGKWEVWGCWSCWRVVLGMRCGNERYSLRGRYVVAVKLSSW